MVIPYISRKLQGYFWGEVTWQALNPVKKWCKSHLRFPFIVAILKLLQNRNLILINQVHEQIHIQISVEIVPHGNGSLDLEVGSSRM